jgi:hypothetical protein
MSTQVKAKASSLNSQMGLEDINKIEAELIKISSDTKKNITSMMDDLSSEWDWIPSLKEANARNRLLILLVVLAKDDSVVDFVGKNKWIIKVARPTPVWMAILGDELRRYTA